MDVHIIVDALTSVMGMEDKEFCKVGELAVAIMIETATAVMGNAYKVKKVGISCDEVVVIIFVCFISSTAQQISIF